VEAKAQMKKPKSVAEVQQVDLYQAFRVAYDRTNKADPDPAHVKELRALLRANPDAGLWRIIAGLSDAAEAQLLCHDSISPALREVWRLRLKALREEMGYEGAPPVERLLISHAVVCWLRLNLCEIVAGHVLNQSVSLTLAAFWEKRLSQAQRRFTRACESLERIRALTATTRLIESRTEGMGAPKRVNNLRTVKSLTP
jgi:hypothetical protein